MHAQMNDRELLSEPAGVAARGRRVRVMMPVLLEIAPNCTVKAIIDDLSAKGFRLRSRVVLHVGQQVTMRLPRGNATCRLHWVDGLRAGGEFIDEAKEPSW